MQQKPHDFKMNLQKLLSTLPENYQKYFFNADQTFKTNLKEVLYLYLCYSAQVSHDVVENIIT
jgi:hypothetical protein